MGIIFDLIFLVILVCSALHGRAQGFVAGAVTLVGAVIGMIAAVVLAGALSAGLYENVIGQTLARNVADALAAQGADLPQVLQQNLGFLPQELLAQISALIQQAMDQAGTDLMPVILTALRPVVLPILQALLFLVLFVVIRWLVNLIARATRLVNRLPLLGGVNQLLGLATGLVTGLLDVWMLCLVIWGLAAITGGAGLLADANLSGSMVYRLFSAWNPFVG